MVLPAPYQSLQKACRRIPSTETRFHFGAPGVRPAVWLSNQCLISLDDVVADAGPRERFRRGTQPRAESERVLSCHGSGNKSQNQKESRQTISPKENFTGSRKAGPSKTNV